MLFGERGESIQIPIERSGSSQEMKITLAEEMVSKPPKLGSFFVIVKPIVNWRGDHIPCMGAGPASMAAISYCDHHFRPFSYLKLADAGGAGLKFDDGNEQFALVKEVVPNSPAAQAGLQPGDRVSKVDGNAVGSGVGDQLRQLLFGKAGAKLKMTVTRQGRPRKVELVPGDPSRHHQK